MSSKRRAKAARHQQRVASRGITPGTLDVLSVGHGHMKVTITPGDEAEIAKARRMIEDMLARGFSIFIELANGETRRVKKFDPKKMIYFIDPPEALGEEPLGAAPAPVKKPGTKHRLTEVPVARARATAVGRTAGG